VLVAGELDLDRGIAMAEAGRAIPPRPNELVLFLPQPPPEHALGLARLKQGRLAEAVSLLEAAARLKPNRALIQQHLAEARSGG
jgi:tetratricopeptide (TPR) repeat protein